MLQIHKAWKEKERVRHMRNNLDPEMLRSRLDAGRAEARGPNGGRPRRILSVSSLLLISLPALLVFAPVALSGPPELRLPPDIVYDKAKGSPGPVVFRHATHFELAENRCTACHPRPFRMLRPERLVTHDEMSAGRSCGLCHDGRKAAAADDDCGHCHASGKDAK